MATILQTFSWKENTVFAFWLEFYWSLFLDSPIVYNLQVSIDSSDGFARNRQKAIN